MTVHGATSDGTSWQVVRGVTGFLSVAGFVGLVYAAVFAPDLVPWYLRQYAVGVATVLSLTAMVCHLQLRLAAGARGDIESAATAVVRTAARWAGVGILFYAAVMVYMCWSGGAMPIRYHELLIGPGIAVVIAGVVVAYGLSKAVRVLRTPLNRIPDLDQTETARRRLVLLSRWAGLVAAGVQGSVAYIDVQAPGLVPHYLHQYMVGLGAMPFIVALISHEEARGPDIDRARTYLRVGALGSGGLLVVQWLTHGAVVPRWHEFVLCVSDSLVVAGFLLRYGIYQMSRMVTALQEMQRRVAEHMAKSGGHP
ncbi:hypothetical protein AB0M43_02480 [Longispora sp. NPDC051575]|uniref:hypothetical protein n=1 Tax=Longispora sp. NPDC051575 TaxID=3154943 RepID=UPI00342D67A2